MADKKTTPTWGYSEKEAKIFELEDGRKLPRGFFANPAMVPGSEAMASYIADCERDGAPLPDWAVKAGEKPENEQGSNGN